MVKVNKRNTHYYFKTKPEVDRVDQRYFNVVYDNFIKSLTQGFSEIDWIDFYSREDEFIEKVDSEFGKTRLGHYVLYNWNQDRIHYLRNIIPDDLIGDVEDYIKRFNS